MSASHSPVAGPMFSVPILLTSLVAEGAIIQGEVLSEMAMSSSITASDIVTELSAFVNEGSSLGVFASKELAQGIGSELYHGVKEGGKLFTALIDGSEIIFERCGTAIIGRYANADQAPITEDIARRIDEHYQQIIADMAFISTGSDKIMLEHQERLDAGKRQLKITEISNQNILKELDQLRIQEQESLDKLTASIEQSQHVEAEQTRLRLKEVRKTLDENLEELREKIQLSDKKLESNDSKKLELIELQKVHLTEMEHLEQRKTQSLEYLGTHNLRIRERTDAEIKRIVEQHGIENPNINIDTNESGQIRIVIDQN